VLFLLICAGAYRLRKNTGTRTFMIFLAGAATALVLVAFSVDTLRNAPQTFTAMILLGVLAVVLDAVWRARGGGTEAERPQDAGSVGPA
jgi:hypothetical protein